MRGMMAFLVAVGLTIIGYLLMSRLQSRRESAGSDVSGSGPSYSSGDGWNILPWFGSGSSSLDSSGSSSDSGGDSGGGGGGGGD